MVCLDARKGPAAAAPALAAGWCSGSTTRHFPAVVFAAANPVLRAVPLLLLTGVPTKGSRSFHAFTKLVQRAKAAGATRSPAGSFESIEAHPTAAVAAVLATKQHPSTGHFPQPGSESIIATPIMFGNPGRARLTHQRRSGFRPEP